MHQPFKLACQSKFPNAIIVIDKFHILQLLNDAIKDLIKRIFPSLPLNDDQLKLFNKYHKWLILKASKNLMPAQKTDLSYILSLNSELKSIYDFKELFRTIYFINDVETARSFLRSWIYNSRASKIPELSHVADTYSEWFTFISNYWIYHISNAITEGKVNKIKVFKRKSYNYKNFYSLRYHVLKSEYFNL